MGMSMFFFAGAGDDGLAGGDAFNDAYRCRQNVGDFFAAADAFAEAAVAAFGAHAGGDEVSEAGETGEEVSEAAPAEGDAQARDLD